LRIISGANKGRRIYPPKNLPVRPTTDMAKESLFNILRNHINFESLDVLDLFSGTGNITYEFASRGCKSITAVDLNRRCTTFIFQTVQNLNYRNVFVVQSDYRKFMNNQSRKWDIIYADPPYDLEDLGQIPELVFSNELLKEEGFLIVEHGRDRDFSGHPHFFEHRKYGSVNFSFFRLERKDEEN
jgi:16S rRNA (guanine(966)-N(2))-methyltransferase RsmD